MTVFKIAKKQHHFFVFQILRIDWCTITSTPIDSPAFQNVVHRLVFYDDWGEFVHELTHFFKVVSERKLVGYSLVLKHKRLGRYEFNVDWKDGKPFVREVTEAICKTIENKRESVLTIDGIEYL